MILILLPRMKMMNENRFQEDIRILREQMMNLVIQLDKYKTKCDLLENRINSLNQRLDNMQDDDVKDDCVGDVDCTKNM